MSATYMIRTPTCSALVTEGVSEPSQKAAKPVKRAEADKKAAAVDAKSDSVRVMVQGLTPKLTGGAAEQRRPC